MLSFNVIIENYSTRTYLFGPTTIELSTAKKGLRILPYFKRLLDVVSVHDNITSLGVSFPVTMNVATITNVPAGFIYFLYSFC